MVFDWLRINQDSVHVRAGTHDEEHDEWQAGDATEAPPCYIGATNAYLYALYCEAIGAAHEEEDRRTG